MTLAPRSIALVAVVANAETDPGPPDPLGVPPAVPLGRRRRRALRLDGRLGSPLTADVGGAEIDREALEADFKALAEQRTAFAAALEAYHAAATNLRTALNAALDEQSDTTGWQDILDIAPNPAALLSLLIERKARTTVAKELDAALKQIDAAKEKVLEDKFSDYSGAIQAWWERLRPDEPTFSPLCSLAKGPSARSTSKPV